MLLVYTRRVEIIGCFSQFAQQAPKEACLMPITCIIYHQQTLLSTKPRSLPIPSPRPLPISSLSLLARLQLLRHQRLQCLLIRPHNLPHLLPAPKHHKRRHRPHAQLLRHIRHLIHIQLVETCFWVVVGHGDDVGRDHFAGTAPGRHAVEHHEAWGGEGGVEICFAVGGVSGVVF